ncbi:MAG: hypothetical protein RR561_01500 [Peptostreptococcus sp.]|uniref:hypothetical protein n=1 Tax=Peptostreptococcus TaxID=1257 RepID=UPI001FA93186|nr:hypothetical protein [Peptostreptococcus russellii]
MSKNRKREMRTMSKLFMYGTSLEGIEQLMVMVPNFQPRRSGIVINNYFNCEGGARECNCNVNNSWHKCGYIGSDLKINVDRCRYTNLVRVCFGKINNYFLKERLKNLTNNFKGEVFLNQNHKKKF